MADVGFVSTAAVDFRKIELLSLNLIYIVIIKISF